MKGKMSNVQFTGRTLVQNPSAETQEEIIQ